MLHPLHGFTWLLAVQTAGTPVVRSAAPPALIDTLNIQLARAEAGKGLWSLQHLALLAPTAGLPCWPPCGRYARCASRRPARVVGEHGRGRAGTGAGQGRQTGSHSPKPALSPRTACPPSWPSAQGRREAICANLTVDKLAGVRSPSHPNASPLQTFLAGAFSALGGILGRLAG